MTSRYILTSAPDQVKAHFGLGTIEPFPPRYNIAPTQPVGIIRTGHDGALQFRLVRWGLIPAWVKDPAALSPMFTARAETAAEKPSFRGALRHRRCLVPANGYYEWRGPPKSREPVLFQRPDRGVMGFAGLHEPWLGADGSEIETMAILTVAASATAPNSAERMPLIVPPASYAAWLDCRSGVDFPIERLAGEAPPPLEAVEVSRSVGNPRLEGAVLLDPAYKGPAGTA